MAYRVEKGFTAYIDGKRTHFAKGDQAPSKAVIDECDLLKKGLVALVKKKKPNGAE